MQKLNIRGLVSIGGDGSLSIGQQLFEGGVPLVGVPKTIDNDLEGTVMTFGFDSAVACATDALDRLHTTAESHNRVMVLEVMGRYAGWIALYAGVAGGADVILIPEIPFTFDSICAKIQERERADKHFTLVVVAEGAREKGGEFVTSGGTSLQPRSPAGRHRCRGGRGTGEAHRQGGPRLRPGTHATRRMSYQLRPRALHDLRRRGRGTDRRREVRADGGLSRLWSGLCEDYRSGREIEDGATRGRFCTNGTRTGNLSWRLGENHVTAVTKDQNRCYYWAGLRSAAGSGSR